jgi:hypothetical protein
LALQINTFEDLLHIVDTHPEWRRRLVKALFPEIDLPKALQELIELNRQMRLQMSNVQTRLTTIEERQARTEEWQARTEEWQARTEDRQTRTEDRQTRTEDRQTRLELRVDRIDSRLTNIEGDVARLKGDSYENNVNKKADSIFGFGLRRGHDSRNEIGLQLDLAEEAGQISADESIQVLAADLLWSGRVKQSNEPMTLVVESSWLAEPRDIERALMRAMILSKIGVRSLPVVAAREWPNDVQQTAYAQKVIIVHEYSLDKTSWGLALSASL